MSRLFVTALNYVTVTQAKSVAGFSVNARLHIALSWPDRAGSPGCDIRQARRLTWPQFWRAVASPVTLAAYRLSFGASFFAALREFGFWAVRGVGPGAVSVLGQAAHGRLVDLPFALPTAVAGITLASLYSEHGWIGRWLAPFGIKVSYTSLGVFVALTLLDSVCRPTLQPGSGRLDTEVEGRRQPRRQPVQNLLPFVFLPIDFPALLTGFALAFRARAGRIRFVVFISSNIPFRTQIVPVLIMSKTRAIRLRGATALAVVMLAVSFLLLLTINWLQWWSTRHVEQA